MGACHGRKDKKNDLTLGLDQNEFEPEGVVGLKPPSRRQSVTTNDGKKPKKKKIPRMKERTGPGKKIRTDSLRIQQNSLEESKKRKSQEFDPKSASKYMVQSSSHALTRANTTIVEATVHNQNFHKKKKKKPKSYRSSSVSNKNDSKALKKKKRKSKSKKSKRSSAA